MATIEPELAIRIPESPVRRTLAILGDLFSMSPQPKVQTAAARQCGELLGRHLLNLIWGCGELNLNGLHSSAVSLFRPMEDALDCLAAVTVIAGAAESWESGDLKPSDAAKLWHGRLDIHSAITGEVLPEYRKNLRSLFNQFCHCTPALAYWDLFRKTEPDDNDRHQLRVNHENLIVEATAYRIDAHLVMHCRESLDVVELGYKTYFDLNAETKEELESLKSFIDDLLQRQISHGLLGTFVPPEIEGLMPQQRVENDVVSIEGDWRGQWKCSGGSEVQNATLVLHQKGCHITGSLTTKIPLRDDFFLIVERLSGIVDKGKVLLDGVSCDIRPGGEEQHYWLDTFELQYSTEGARLLGTHSCDLGSGEAMFERP